MVRFIGYDFVDSGNFIETPYDRHDTCDRDLSSEVAGSRIDGRDCDFRPYEVELFYRLPQKFVAVNKHQSFVAISIQTRLEDVAEDNRLAAPRGEGDQRCSISFL